MARRAMPRSSATMPRALRRTPRATLAARRYADLIAALPLSAPRCRERRRRCRRRLLMPRALSCPPCHLPACPPCARGCASPPRSVMPRRYFDAICLLHAFMPIFRYDITPLPPFADTLHDDAHARGSRARTIKRCTRRQRRGSAAEEPFAARVAQRVNARCRAAQIMRCVAQARGCAARYSFSPPRRRFLSFAYISPPFFFDTLRRLMPAVTPQR